MANERRLTAKQRAFVEAYLRNGRKAAEAYRSAYDTKASPQVVAVEAAKLLKHPKIALIVGQADEKAAARIDAAVDRYAVSKERVVEELARMGFANMLDYVSIGADGDAYVDLSALTREQATAIGEVIVEDFKDGRGEDARDVRRIRRIRFKLHDKRAALLDLAKLKGYVVDRAQVRVVRSMTDLSEDELDAILAELGAGDARAAARRRGH